jgi:outer membrane protein OmpA-like peptidoglycan-associated protein
VLFSLNSAKLLPAASGELGRIAADLNSSAKAGSTVAIAGYVSANDGQTVQAGQALSTARAQAVYDALKGRVTKGVHWTVVGKGAADPVVPNDNETDRRLNRRVTITYDR